MGVRGRVSGEMNNANRISKSEEQEQKSKGWYRFMLSMVFLGLAFYLELLSKSVISEHIIYGAKEAIDSADGNPTPFTYVYIYGWLGVGSFLVSIILWIFSIIKDQKRLSVLYVPIAICYLLWLLMIQT